MKESIQAFFAKIKDTPIEFTLRTGVLVILVVFLMDLIVFFIKGEIDLEGVLIEAHGMVFDIILFGLVLAYYNHRLQRKREEERIAREKANRIQRYSEEIEDFQGWNEKEAVYKNVGNIRRLNRMGVTNINLQQSYLEGGKLDRANLENADLFMANLKDADLTDARLYKTKLHFTNFKGANLEGVDLRHANLSHAKFVAAKLKDADLRGCKFQHTIFENCILMGAKVESADWFGTIASGLAEAEVLDKLQKKYRIGEKVFKDENGEVFYRIAKQLRER